MRIDIGGCRLFFDVEGAKLRPDGPPMREVRANLVRFERFANAGHRIVSDQPGRFFEVLRDFIAR